MNKLDMESMDITNCNIEYIKNIFPSVVKEENNKLKIDFELLKQELNNYVIDDKKEKYQLTWPGKRNAINLANSKVNITYNLIM